MVDGKETKTFTTEIHGVFPHQNILRFPRAVDHLNICCQPQRYRTGGLRFALFTPPPQKKKLTTIFYLIIFWFFNIQLFIPLIFTLFSKF
jgi:hypothetical protein